MQKITFVDCHRLPERSFFWKGKQFPFCARCTGIYLGYLTMPIFVFNLFYVNWTVTLLLIFPTFVDGLVQAYTKWVSNNILRVTTGIIAGIGLMSLVSLIGDNIGLFILQLIKS